MFTSHLSNHTLALAVAVHGRAALDSCVMVSARKTAPRTSAKTAAIGENILIAHRQTATQFRALPQSRASSYTSGIQASLLENTTTIWSLP